MQGVGIVDDADLQTVEIAGMGDAADLHTMEGTSATGVEASDLEVKAYV